MSNPPDSIASPTCHPPPDDASRRLRRPAKPKLSDQFSYPPRAMRAERAAAYLDMAKSTFLRLVEEGVMPKPVKVKGVVAWDRLDLDAAFDGLKEDAAGNSMHKLLGMGGRQ